MGAGIRFRLQVGLVAVAALAAVAAQGVPAQAAGFSPAAGSPFANAGGTGSLALGDLNGDGAVDAVVTDPSAGALVTMLGDGRGALTRTSSVATGGTKPAGVALVDLNGDGRLDAAVANDGSHNLSILLGDGAGSFTPAARSPVITDSARPTSVTIGDFNGDGRPDVAVVNFSSADVSILLSDGQGGLTLASAPVETGGDHPGPAAVGDFNGDGMLDIAVANESGDVSVLVGDGTGRLHRGGGSPFGLSPAGLGAGDFNGDGKLDVAVANKTGTISILLGNGTGSLTPLPGSAPAITAGTGPASLVVADVDLDGKLDILVANGGSGDISVLAGDGAAGFSPAVGTPISTGGPSPSALAIGDLNRDGTPDLAAVNVGSPSVSVLLNGVTPPPAAGGVRGQFAGAGSLRSSLIRLIAPFPIVRIKGRTSPRGAHIKLLEVLAPAGVKVTVRCRGKGCPFHRWSSAVGGKTVTVKLLRGRFLRTGTTLEIRVYAEGMIGKYTRIVIGKIKPPKRKDLCLAPGSSAAAPCPAG